MRCRVKWILYSRRGSAELNGCSFFGCSFVYNYMHCKCDIWISLLYLFARYVFYGILVMWRICLKYLVIMEVFVEIEFKDNSWIIHIDGHIVFISINSSFHVCQFRGHIALSLKVTNFTFIGWICDYYIVYKGPD